MYLTYIEINHSHFIHVETHAIIWRNKVIDMGWLRWVGCLKIQVSLQNTGLFCRALLQKRPIFLSILLIVATPYLMYDVVCIWHNSKFVIHIPHITIFIYKAMHIFCMTSYVFDVYRNWSYIFHTWRNKFHTWHNMTQQSHRFLVYDVVCIWHISKLVIYIAFIRDLVSKVWCI